MIDLSRLFFAVLASLFKSRAELEAENLVLRQQVNVLRRRMPKRPALKNVDRLLFVLLHHWFPSTAGDTRSMSNMGRSEQLLLAWGPATGQLENITSDVLFSSTPVAWCHGSQFRIVRPNP